MNVKPKILKLCKICKKDMFLSPSLAKRKTLCSKECNSLDIKSRKNMLGKKHSEETKKKMSDGKKGQIAWNKGLKGYGAGKNHYRYIHGLSQTKEYKKESQKQWVEKNRLRKNYLTLERRALQMKAEGSHSFEEWKELKESFKNICLCCKRAEPSIVLTQDHIIPLSKGGTNDIKNIQPLCRSCNSRKYTKQIDYISIYQLTQISP